MFWNKKQKDAKTEEKAPVIAPEELIRQAESKAEKLENAGEDERLNLLNEIGALYYEASEYDKAIVYYEQSLNIKKQMGKPYTNLMSLYNKKRQQAAEAKNDEEISYYLSKVQEMMQMSKDMLRGKV